MFNNNNLGKLQQQLCELKLAERRVCNDIHNLSTASKLVDFAAAKKLQSNRTSLQKQIASVEAKIMPNIIA